MTRNKPRALIHASGGSKAERKAKARGTRMAGFSGKKRPPQAIIDTNRKTEICRNWQKGCCTFEGRCAFAHGVKELKYRTLREMEKAGRIPDASKYRCYPCMSWVATGSCPFGTRCVFIHDPRVGGPELDGLHAPYGGSGVTTFFPTGNTPFFFPDIARDIDSKEVPTHLARYDIDARMDSTAEASCWTAHTLWHSFVSVFVSSSTIVSVGPDDKAKSVDTIPNTNTDADAKTIRGVSRVDSPLRVSSVSPESKQKRCRHLQEGPEFSRSHTRVKHLPVFEGLSRGAPAHPSVFPTPEKSLVNGRGPTGDVFPVGATPVARTRGPTPSTSSSAPAFSFWASSPIEPAADESSPLHTDDSDCSSSNIDAGSYLSEVSSASDSSYFTAHGYQAAPSRGVDTCPGRGLEAETSVPVAMGESGPLPPTLTAGGQFRPAFALVDGLEEGRQDSDNMHNHTNTNSYGPDGDYRSQQEHRPEATPQRHVPTNRSGVIGQPLPSSSSRDPASRLPTGSLGGCGSDFSYFTGGQAFPGTGTSYCTQGSTAMLMPSTPSADLDAAADTTGCARQEEQRWQRTFCPVNVDERQGAIWTPPAFSAEGGSDEGDRGTFSPPSDAGPADGLVCQSGCRIGTCLHHYQEPQSALNTESGAAPYRSDGASLLGGSTDTNLYRMASMFHTPPF